MDTESSWGTYAPRNRDALIRLLTQTGLARGKLTRYVHLLWRHAHGDVIDIEVRGIKYRLDICHNMTDIKILSSSKQYDKTELHFLADACRGGTFVDLGANVGYYSLALAKAGAAHVLSIEPNPPTLERLRYNISINEFESVITVAPFGVGDYGSAELFCEGGLGEASLIQKNSDPEKAVTIQTRPLSAILDDHGIQQIDGMKVDIEGVEDLALIPFFKSAPEERWPGRLVIEHAHQADWGTDLLAYLISRGYSQKAVTRANTLLSRTR